MIFLCLIAQKRIQTTKLKKLFKLPHTETFD